MARAALWAAMDSNDDERIYLFDEKPIDHYGDWQAKYGYLAEIDSRLIPELTYENSPKQVELNLARE
jgi:hypothetical protein